MRKTYRYATNALREALLNRIRKASGKPVPITELIRIAKRQAFTAGEVRRELWDLSEAGQIVYSCNPIAFEVAVVEVGE